MYSIDVSRLSRLPALAAFTLFGASALFAQPSLFRGPGTPENPGPNVVVRHGIEVAADVLSNNPASLWIDLPDAPAVLVQQTGFERRKGNGLVWRGQVPYVSDSQVVLTRHKGLLAGTVQLDGDTYEILPGPGRGHAISRLDHASFPGCEGGVLPPGLANVAQNDTAGVIASAAPAAAGEADPAAQIDLLSVYTPEARDAAGGVAQVEATIQAAVDNANTAFVNSNMVGRYVLVHTALANYNDTGNLSTDLSWLYSDAATAALRNQYGADMVSLIVENGGSGCGIGYVQRNPGPGFASAAFQVTDRGCAVGNLSFAHEHGHNSGMEHDPANSSAYPSGGSFAWSFGAVIGANVARTVMTYPGACNNCPRVMHHSNPDILYQGLYPTGVADQFDNARTGDYTHYIIHDFRASVNPATLLSISVTPTTADIDTGATQQFTATGHYDDNSTGDLTFAVTWASSNSGVATINSSGVATGHGDGSAGITAALDGVTSNAATLNVTTPPPATLTSITVSPTTAEIESGQTQAFAATGHYDDNSTANITTSVTWASSNPVVATIAASGVATGVAEGSAGITASLDGVTSAAAALTVTPPAPPLAISGISPSQVNPDKFSTVTVSGEGFSPDAVLSFANGAGQAPSVTMLSVAGNQLTASIYPPGNGPKRDRVWDVVVTNGNGQSVVLGGALTVTFNTITNNPPSVSISSPGNGSTHALGASISFTGSANDAEDGNISANLSWSSNLSGAIGSGASFSTAGLIEGVHTITASVTDSGGASRSASITITVGSPNTAPNVTISSPGNGATFTEGDSVSFAGTANDDQDGGLTAGLTWTSSRDGVIGSGAGFSTTGLSVGTHTITAAVTDSGSLTGSASIILTINSNSPGVTVSSVSPGVVSRGTQPTLAISGSGFAAGAVISFENGSGPAPSVLNTIVNGDASISVKIDVPKGGKGARTWDVRVTNLSGATGALAGALTIN